MKKILNIQSTNKGKFGVCEFSNGRKVFFKVCNYSIQSEIEGYNNIKNYYNVPKRIYFNYDKNLIVYEYNDNLFNKTLHYGLYEYGNVDIKNIVKMLTSPFLNMNIDHEDDCKNSKFFKQRIGFIDTYLNCNNSNFKKQIFIDNQNYGSFDEILRKIRFALSTTKDVYSIISQGDPTDLNIGIYGEITDYEVAGTNSAIGEIAVFLGCFIVNSYYYYIKYINSSHKLYTNTLKNFEQFVNPTYIIGEKNIIINLKSFLPKKNKLLILEYLNELVKYPALKNNVNLGKYIAFRFISPVNLISITEEKDLIFLIGLVSKFEKFTSIDEIIKYIEKV